MSVTRGGLISCPFSPYMMSQYQVKQVLIISHLRASACLRLCVRACVRACISVLLYLKCINYSHSVHGSCSLEGIYTKGTMNTVTGNITVVPSSCTVHISMYVDTHYTTQDSTVSIWTLYIMWIMCMGYMYSLNSQNCIARQQFDFRIIFKVFPWTSWIQKITKLNTQMFKRIGIPQY